MQMYIGIDVSKKTFDIAYKEANMHWVHKQYQNDAKGIKKFIDSLKEQTYCVLEATGSYSVLLTYMLCKKSIPVSVLNPKQSSYYNKMMLNTVKTDKADARTIAEYAMRMELKEYRMPEDSFLEAKQLRTLLRHLKKQKTSLANLEESLNPLPVQNKQAKESIKKSIKFIDKEIKRLEEEITKVSTDEMNRLVAKLSTIVGVSTQVATAVVLSTNGFKDFDNAKKYSRYVGISPKYFESGTSVKKKGVICRSGDPQLRALLYMATWSAIRFNKACKKLYLRLKEKGKPSKLALIAVANKLVRQMFAIVKNNTIFNNDYELNAA